MKPMANSIGVVNWSEPPHIVPIQLKIFTPGGDGDQHRASSAKTASAIGPMPAANMWWLHTPKPRKAMNTPGEDHDGVAEQRLAGEDRQDLGDDAEGRQDQDVDLGMAEDPEQVLPQQRVAAAGRDEEVGAEEAVEHQQDQRDRDDREGEQQQELRDEAHPARTSACASASCPARAC